MKIFSKSGELLAEVPGDTLSGIGQPDDRLQDRRKPERNQMTQDQVNAMVLAGGISIKSLRESGATAEQLYATSTWLSTQPEYRGEFVKSHSVADRMLGPSHPYQRNTIIRESANMCQIAAGDIQAELLMLEKVV
jgi:hypothetical protein